MLSASIGSRVEVTGRSGWPHRPFGRMSEDWSVLTRGSPISSERALRGRSATHGVSQEKRWVVSSLAIGWSAISAQRGTPPKPPETDMPTAHSTRFTTPLESPTIAKNICLPVYVALRPRLPRTSFPRQQPRSNRATS